MTIHFASLAIATSALTIGSFGVVACSSATTATALAGAAGNAATGAKLFLQCGACHTVGPADASGVGPNLSGVAGAKAGAKAGYTFSPALKASNVTWTPAALDAWLKKPSALVPGNKMAFAGIASPQARADVIAYLTTLKARR